MFRYAPPGHFSTYPVCIAWDLAIGQKQQNDYTVGAVGYLDMYDNIHVLEIVRGKWNTHQISEMILGIYQKYDNQTTGSVLVGIENGQLQLAIMPHLNKLMDEARCWISFDETLTPLTDKLARARPLQGRMQQGRVFFPPESTDPWVADTRHELLRFPGGVFDDQVDALAWLARMFANISAPKSKKPKQLKSWKDRLKVYTSDQKHPMMS